MKKARQSSNMCKYDHKQCRYNKDVKRNAKREIVTECCSRRAWRTREMSPTEQKNKLRKKVMVKNDYNKDTN